MPLASGAEQYPFRPKACLGDSTQQIERPLVTTLDVKRAQVSTADCSLHYRLWLITSQQARHYFVLTRAE